jgi:RNA polymerase sigma-70 factor (ECF subfamily)
VTVPAAESATDEALAASAAAGDVHAFEALVGRYEGRVYRLACRMTSDADAPDVLQETFLQAYRHVASFRGEAKFSTWLYRIATNASLMLRRSRSRRPSEPLDAFLPQFQSDGQHRGTPAELQIVCRIEELIDREALAARARDAIARLPDLYRDAFVLRDLEEMPAAEVAEVLGIEAAAVRQRVHRARLLLRGYLADLAAKGTP